MSRKRVFDVKSKVGFRMRDSLQLEIERLSEKLGISRSVVVDMILSANLPIFEEVYAKKLMLLKKDEGVL